MFDDEDTVDELPPMPPRKIAAADLELLRLAARALGAAEFQEIDGEGWVVLHFADAPAMFAWNPLEHSDDALILSIKLGMSIKQVPNGSPPHVSVFTGRGQERVDEEYARSDEVAATRRAIVRAAVEIGKDME